jgi:large subunit ribosomal protein L23
MRKSVHSVVQRPILTEKSTHGIETLNAYVFEVGPNANKIEIRRAIEEIFEVKVLKVNIRKRRGKRKRMGRSIGFSKDVKEAIVTLKTGDKIDVY